MSNSSLDWLWVGTANRRTSAMYADATLTKVSYAWCIVTIYVTKALANNK